MLFGLGNTHRNSDHFPAKGRHDGLAVSVWSIQNLLSGLEALQGLQIQVHQGTLSFLLHH